jgi:hypothetical protein
MSSGHRQRQLPSARPETFIRASAPRLSTSCRGTIASAAGEDHASSIRAGAASLLRASGRFRHRQSRRNASDQLGWPFEVISAVMSELQRPEQRVVLRPMPMRIAELPIIRLQSSGRPSTEVAPSLFEPPTLERDDRGIIDRWRRKRLAHAVASPQQSILDQAVWADQLFVTGERRQRSVRRISVPRRA